ncbi:MAG: hypothetical protein A3F10_06165 [Coxiella sp. RIFCSPHIGHO2_12_FULL_42_15]|nr:MAG: hypothetical protein A3F10_06165 [Coxiella sp. RIFCSPHIGHO2_12_FULL_42_15]
MLHPVIVGKFGGTHGVHGWIKVLSFTQPAENIQKYLHWFVKVKGQWQPLHIEAQKTHGETLLIKIKDINTPEEVRRYTNCLIGIEQNQLPTLPEGEYYWSQLIGLTVITTDGRVLGKIDYLFATGANDIIVVKDRDHQEHLLPYINNVIKSVDLAKAEMHVDWDIDET